MTSTPFGPRPPVSIPPDSAAPPSGSETQDAGSATDAAQNADAGEGSVILNPEPAWTPPSQAGVESAETPWWSPSIVRESDNLLAPMLLAFGVILMVTLMMRHLRRKSMNRPVPQPTEDRIASIHERATGSIGPVERTMAEAEQLARRLSATMENKAARLELLIEEADRKLEELNRAIAQTSRAAPVSAERATRSVRSIDPSVLDRARVEQDRAERNGHQPAMPAPTLGPKPPEHGPADPVHRRVWALADDGMPTLEIARSLNQPVGQVELILNLRKSG